MISIGTKLMDVYNSLYPKNINKSRGVLIVTKKGLTVQEIKLKNEFEGSLWCRIKINESDCLLIGCIYRSPNISQNNDNKLMKLISEIKQEKVSHLLIAGDFNLQEIN